ncbi:GNAT family N-acetyltransferase, partial [bacterium]|nr:GNAT family N-acetyltransferase [bacterium]
KVKGKGFTLLHQGQIASTAYSAFVHEGILEIGIETVDGFRGKGFAELTCSALIDHCLESDLVPIWSCRLENTASYELAQKLGFEPILQIPFYRLSN